MTQISSSLVSVIFPLKILEYMNPVIVAGFMVQKPIKVKTKMVNSGNDRGQVMAQRRN